ncbi:hypothetical protein R1flu_008744, partial [Riccia fluitans]
MVHQLRLRQDQLRTRDTQSWEQTQGGADLVMIRHFLESNTTTSPRSAIAPTDKRFM